MGMLNPPWDGNLEIDTYSWDVTPNGCSSSS